MLKKKKQATFSAGDDSDDWMEDYRVDQLRDSYAKKWSPVTERISQALVKAGYTPKAFVEYGKRVTFPIK